MHTPEKPLEPEEGKQTEPMDDIPSKTLLPTPDRKQQLLQAGRALLTWFIIYICFIDVHLVLFGSFRDLNYIQTFVTLLTIPFQLVINDLVNVVYYPFFVVGWLGSNLDRYLMYVNGVIFLVLNLGFTGAILIHNRMRKEVHSSINLSHFYIVTFLGIFLIFSSILGWGYYWYLARIRLLLSEGTYNPELPSYDFSFNLCFLIIGGLCLVFFLFGESGWKIKVVQGGRNVLHWLLAYACLTGVEYLVFILCKYSYYSRLGPNDTFLVLYFFLSGLISYVIPFFYLGSFFYWTIFPQQMSYLPIEWYFIYANAAVFLLQNLVFTCLIILINRAQRDKYPFIKLVWFYYLSLVSTGLVSALIVVNWIDRWVVNGIATWVFTDTGNIYLILGFLTPTNFCYFVFSVLWIGLLFGYIRGYFFLKRPQYHITQKNS